MKRIIDPDKLYYDVTIDHDPQHKEHRFEVSSKAETTIDLAEPLIENPGNYMLSITKFKIDTECIPLMIPEMQQPQDLTNKYVSEQNKMQTKYQVMVHFVRDLKTTTVIKDKGGNIVKKEEESNSQSSLAKVENIYVQHYKYNKDKTNLTKYLGYAKKDDGTDDTTKAYINNTDEQCFVFDYGAFLYAVNLAIEKICSDLSEKECFEDFKKTRIAYFTLDNGDLIYFANKRLNTPYTSTETATDAAGNVTTITKVYEINKYGYNDILFSPELYKYIGNGFPCSFADEKQYPDFKGWWRINYCYKFFNNHGTEYPSTTFSFTSGDYNFIRCAYSTFSNWNILKAIIIGSNSLPVVEEYLPISNKDGFLTHYNTPEYKKALKDLGIEHNVIREIFKKNTQRVLDIYYPLSTSAGDVRSSIIYSAENTNHGQNIELVPGSPIRHFDIWVKWMDIYGNLYDLYLYPGCSVDIRMCFTKKPLMKEDLAEGLDAVMECLPEKKQKKQRVPTGKPGGIVIDGADKWGFVHI